MNLADQMNLASLGGDPKSELIFVNYNQDRTSLAVGTKTGYKLFSLTSVDKLENIYSNDAEDICVVERLFSSSLVAIVSLSAPRKLKVCHFKKGTEICNYSYSNTILAVRLNRLRLVVCLEESLYIHNIRDMKVLHTIRDTPPNPHGVCALSVSNDNCYLAYPGSTHVGEVQIFDTCNLRAVTMIPAHDNPLVAMTFNATGTRLATASGKGTVIRVFSVPDGQKMFEFRRGVKRCVSIYTLAFSLDSLFLCCSSNTETVHIFKLENTKDKPSEEPHGWMGYFGQALKSSANYLPSQVTEVFSQGRDFALARLPFSGLINVCALAVIQKLPRLLVASQDGYLYIYNLDPVEGGECTLLKQHRLDGHELTADKAGKVSEPPAPLTAPPDSTKAKSAAGSELPPASYSSTGKTPLPYNSSAAGKSYARVLMTAGDDMRSSPCSLSQALCEEGATACDDEDPCVDHCAIGDIRLDDENEFPPMTHKSD